jgi:hypothetical protein
MMADLFAIMRRNRVRLPREMILLFKALLLIEALAMRLDPEFRLGEALEPYAERLSWERLRASVIARRLVKATTDVGELALELPGVLRRLVDVADTTGIQVHLRAAELEPLVGRAERIGNRLVVGMIGAALITGIGGLVAGDRRVAVLGGHDGGRRARSDRNARNVPGVDGQAPSAALTSPIGPTGALGCSTAHGAAADGPRPRCVTFGPSGAGARP